MGTNRSNDNGDNDIGEQNSKLDLQSRMGTNHSSDNGDNDIGEQNSKQVRLSGRLPTDLI